MPKGRNPEYESPWDESPCDESPWDETSPNMEKSPKYGEIDLIHYSQSRSRI